jgi:hypothetical protein
MEVRQGAIRIFLERDAGDDLRGARKPTAYTPCCAIRRIVGPRPWFRGIVNAG